MQARARRGRPRQADPRQIALQALRLFELRGFDQVTMDEIAEAASVSRRTLFRHFPSKSDLVWEGLRDLRDAVKLLAASLPRGRVRLGQIVDALFVPILQQLDEPEAASIARRRLRLIAGAPALLNHPMLEDIEAVIAAALKGSAQRKAAPPTLVARTLVAATFGALLWWAAHGKRMSALATARAALQAIAKANDA
jgi:AcrR family transcriptional regulator